MPVSLVYGPGSNQHAGAILSPDRSYRYVLERRWGSGPFALFVGLNPSTADEHVDDQTIRKCRGFAQRWSCGGLLMGNLYAFRARKPSDLAKADDPVGPDCDIYLQTMALRSMITVAAWGANKMATAERIQQVREVVGPMLCLGTTKSGQPLHPCYLKYERELVALST